MLKFDVEKYHKWCLPEFENLYFTTIVLIILTSIMLLIMIILGNVIIYRNGIKMRIINGTFFFFIIMFIFKIGYYANEAVGYKTCF